jgi:hypothetical protein
MTKSRNPTQPPKPRTRSASRYKRSETSRLLQGAKDAGLTVRGIEVDPATGVLRVLVGKPDAPDDSGNSWDEVLNAKDAKRAS